MNKRSRIKVLISAIGGDTGQAIAKSLRFSGRDFVCHGCDIEDNEIGKILVDTFHIVPQANAPDYLSSIDSLARDLAADVFFPGSEQEISILAGEGAPQHLPCGIPIVCQSSRIISTFGDKLTCMQALEASVPLAGYANGRDLKAVKRLIRNVGFPLIIKERQSRGSKSICTVLSADELTTILKNYESPLVQEYIDDKSGEYSVGIFSDTKSVESIAFLRRLGLTGASWYAEMVEDKEILEYSEKIARIIAPCGSINIQVRKSSQGVRLLEVNPRFSSLTAARAACGFNDVVWSLDLTLNGTYTKDGPYKKIRFKRYISELIDIGDGFEAVPEWVPIRQDAAKTLRR